MKRRLDLPTKDDPEAWLPFIGATIDIPGPDRKQSQRGKLIEVLRGEPFSSLVFEIDETAH